MMSRCDCGCRGRPRTGLCGFRWSGVSSSSGRIIWPLSRQSRLNRKASNEFLMPGIELHHIIKSFGSVRAVNDVSLTIAPATVHGLLGENGAGKTTLMNILYGMVQRDGGEIRIDGRAVHLISPRDAIANGIGMVHQHFMLAGALSVLDNVLLGDHRQGFVLDRAAAARRLEKLAKDLELEVNLSTRVEELSVGQQQRVEILKALLRDVSLLILD